jgi:hypothetical protein
LVTKFVINQLIKHKDFCKEIYNLISELIIINRKEKLAAQQHVLMGTPGPVERVVISNC